MRSAIKALSAIVVGAIAAPYLIWIWAQVAGRGLIFDPLFSLGLRNASLHVAIASADFLASIVMLLPVALAIRCLGIPHLVLHTGFAALALFAASSAIIGWPLWPQTWQDFLLNLSPYAALCAAVWMCAAITGRPPNNSFKPTPLRGAA